MVSARAMLPAVWVAGDATAHRPLSSGDDASGNVRKLFRFAALLLVGNAIYQLAAPGLINANSSSAVLASSTFELKNEEREPTQMALAEELHGDSKPEKIQESEQVGKASQLKDVDVSLPVPAFNASCIPTVLASYPGSGSTVSRLLIEMATGVWTGSIYSDQSLLHASPHAFLGEATTEKVVAVKTHGPISNHNTFPAAKRAVLMVRNPFAAIPSYVNWLYGFTHKKAQQHQLQAPLEYWESWKTKNNNLEKQVAAWSKHFSYWAVQYQTPDKFFVGKFEDLVSKDTGPETLMDLAKFLDFPIEYGRVEILWRKAMNISFGIHRDKPYFPQYTAEQASMIVKALQDTRGSTNNSILDAYLSNIDRYVVHHSNDTKTP